MRRSVLGASSRRLQIRQVPRRLFAAAAHERWPRRTSPVSP